MRYWESRKSAGRTSKKSRTTQKRLVASGGSLKNAPFLRQFYQHQATISDNLQKFFFFLILATLLYAFVLGDGGAIRIFSLKKQQSKLESEIAELERTAELLRSEISHLESDPFYMEQLGRQYGYTLKGEKIYKIIPRVDKNERLDK